MNILMVTNTYVPHVGGVARSVTTFAEQYRSRGHRVLVVAPVFPGMSEVEPDVIRVRALQNFNGSDFSVVLTAPLYLTRAVEAFRPDVIHSHHPFLLGGTAMRLARSLRVPLVFTHHTFYERYTHYVPGDSPPLKRFVVHLCCNYANMSSEVFAPSESVAEILRARGVKTPITVVPSGVGVEDFQAGSGEGLRAALGFPETGAVVGHVGRLAEEKNLDFLARALASFLIAVPDSHGLVVGDGPSKERMIAILREAGVLERACFTGTLQGRLLVSAYRAMDVFAFSSLTETQGLVLAEAMAAGVPVVALDAPGAREVVRDGVNGRLLPTAEEGAFADALAWVIGRPPAERASMRAAAVATAQALSLPVCAELALSAYERLIAANARVAEEDEAWHRTLRLLRAEWDLAAATMGAASQAFQRQRQRQPLKV